MQRRDLPSNTKMLVPIAAFVAVGSFIVYEWTGPSASSTGKPANALDQVAFIDTPKRDGSISIHDSVGSSAPERITEFSSEIASLHPSSRAIALKAKREKGGGVTSEITEKYDQTLAAGLTDPHAALEDDEYFVGVDPSLPGHAISSLGLRVAVEGQIMDLSGEPNGLELSVTPEEKTAERDEVEKGKLTPRLRGSYAAGFSQEDALFRMKWGWTAYDAAKRAAQDSQ